MKFEKLLEGYDIPIKGREAFVNDKLFFQLNFVWRKVEVPLRLPKISALQGDTQYSLSRCL
jgi:hypothetical protein